MQSGLKCDCASMYVLHGRPLQPFRTPGALLAGLTVAFSRLGYKPAGPAGCLSAGPPERVKAMVVREDLLLPAASASTPQPRLRPLILLLPSESRTRTLTTALA